jgi:hypothetical protein
MVPSFFSKLTFYQMRNVVSGINFYQFNSIFLPIVFGKRNGIIFFRLSYATWSLKVSFFFLVELLSRRGTFFYVDDFNSFRWVDYLKNFSLLNQLAINFWRWPPGLFTNFRMYSKLFFSRGVWFKTNNEVFFSCNPKRLPNVVFLPKVKFGLWPYDESSILRIPLMIVSDGSFFKYSVLFLLVGDCNYADCVVFYVKFLLLATIKGTLREIKFFFKISNNIILRRRINFLKIFFFKFYGYKYKEI